MTEFTSQIICLFTASLHRLFVYLLLHFTAPVLFSQDALQDWCVVPDPVHGCKDTRFLWQRKQIMKNTAVEALRLEARSLH
jgi:alpha-L-fucosidase